jgi:diguanylate cyclase (GGDEF)-like protein
MPLGAARVIDPSRLVDDRNGPSAQRRLRHAGALLFGAGAATLAAVTLAPDPDPSDHPALLRCAALCALAALVLLLWRRAPGAALHAVPALGALAVSVVMALAEPIGLVPAFYLWPMLVAAYFLSPREVAVNFAVAMGACAATLAWFVDPGLRLAVLVGVAAIVGVAGAVVVALRGEVLALVERLRAQATLDALTGAANRWEFERRLLEELQRAERTGAACALLVFDIDHFKRINDSFGHAAGDETLRAVAREAAAVKRRTDFFARIGGEEFALVLPDTDAAGALVLAHALRDALAAADVAHPVTLSVGVTDRAISGTTATDMLEGADGALYAAKREGRDRIARAVPGSARLAAAPDAA